MFPSPQEIEVMQLRPDSSKLCVFPLLLRHTAAATKEEDQRDNTQFHSLDSDRPNIFANAPNVCTAVEGSVMADGMKGVGRQARTRTANDGYSVRGPGLFK